MVCAGSAIILERVLHLDQLLTNSTNRCNIKLPGEILQTLTIESGGKSPGNTLSQEDNKHVQKKERRKERLLALWEQTVQAHQRWKENPSAQCAWIFVKVLLNLLFKLYIALR